MKPLSYLFLGICLSVVVFFGWTLFNQPSAAQKQAREQWEYATIIAAYSFNPSREKNDKIAGIAVVCYIQNNGCRINEIKHEVDYTDFLQARSLPLEENNSNRTTAGIRASEVAFQKALAQLGSEGWEMVGEPHLDFEFMDYYYYQDVKDKSVLFNRKNTKAVYFKRLKNQ